MLENKLLDELLINIKKCNNVIQNEIKTQKEELEIIKESNKTLDELISYVDKLTAISDNLLNKIEEKNNE